MSNGKSQWRTKRKDRRNMLSDNGCEFYKMIDRHQATSPGSL